VNYLFCRTCPTFAEVRTNTMARHEGHSGTVVDVTDDEDVARIFSRWLDMSRRYEQDRFGLDAGAGAGTAGRCAHCGGPFVQGGPVWTISWNRAVYLGPIPNRITQRSFCGRFCAQQGLASFSDDNSNDDHARESH